MPPRSGERCLQLEVFEVDPLCGKSLRNLLRAHPGGQDMDSGSAGENPDRDMPVRASCGDCVQHHRPSGRGSRRRRPRVRARAARSDVCTRRAPPTRAGSSRAGCRPRCAGLPLPRGSCHAASRRRRTRGRGCRSVTPPAWLTSTFASACGRWLVSATRRSCAEWVDRDRVAPSCATRSCVPVGSSAGSVSAVGVRNQEAPSNKPGLALLAVHSSRLP